MVVLQTTRSFAKSFSPLQARYLTTIVMGPPGGGKGTISKKLIKDFGFSHISTGDVLRAEIRDGTELGKEAKSYMDSGGLVPDQLVIDMVLGKIGEIKAAGGRVLLDGFPRTVTQAKELDAKFTVDVAMNLAVPNEDIVKRISSRWTHPASGRVYAYDYNPPKKEGLDDDTGEPLIQRDDDKPEAVRARLKAYDDQTAPLVGHYEAQGVMKQFDGSDFPDLVAADNVIRRRHGAPELHLFVIHRGASFL